MTAPLHTTPSRRRGRIAAAALALGVVTSLAVTAPADANSHGCTWANGGGGFARNCLDVDGYGTKVDGVWSQYKVGFSVWPPNLVPDAVCHVKHQLLWTPDGGQAQTLEQDEHTCQPGLPLMEFTVSWRDLGYAQDGSQICTRTTSELAKPDGEWSYWACGSVSGGDWYNPFQW
jgi:hypothetical protein